MSQSITDLIDLETLDHDGALREAEHALTRAGLLRKAGVAAGAIGVSGAVLGGLPALASAKTSPKQDIAILNYALTLEYLEAAFYKEAVDKGRFPGRTGELAGVVAGHEAAHVAFLKKALGSHAIKSPRFDFKDTTTVISKFRGTAFVLENTGVMAYSGQVTRFHNPAYLQAAATILTIEARHASAFGFLIGGRLAGKQGITPNGAFDKYASMAQILKAVKGTHFIV